MIYVHRLQECFIPMLKTCMYLALESLLNLSCVFWVCCISIFVHNPVVWLFLSLFDLTRYHQSLHCPDTHSLLSFSTHRCDCVLLLSSIIQYGERQPSLFCIHPSIALMWLILLANACYKSRPSCVYHGGALLCWELGHLWHIYTGVFFTKYEVCQC